GFCRFVRQAAVYAGRAPQGIGLTAKIDLEPPRHQDTKKTPRRPARSETRRSRRNTEKEALKQSFSLCLCASVVQVFKAVLGALVSWWLSGLRCVRTSCRSRSALLRHPLR